MHLSGFAQDSMSPVGLGQGLGGSTKVTYRMLVVFLDGMLIAQSVRFVNI